MPSSIKKIYNFQTLSEIDVNSILSGLQQLQITLANAVKSTAQQSTAKAQQPDSPESTTRDDISAIVEPIHHITEIFKARTPQHPSSQSNDTYPQPAYKRQSTPGSSPSKK